MLDVVDVLGGLDVLAAVPLMLEVEPEALDEVLGVVDDVVLDVLGVVDDGFVMLPRVPALAPVLVLPWSALEDPLVVDCA